MSKVLIIAEHDGKALNPATAKCVTCAHLIRDCEARGYQTYWNCARQNLASAAVARKLGYRTEKEYRLLAWFKRNQ